MAVRQDDFTRLCRGLAHELSNVLTYLLPAFEELEGAHRELQPALLGLSADPAAALEALRRLGAELSPDDLVRLGRQLQLAGTRLQQLFRDLRLGFSLPRPAEIVPVDLRAALREAVQEAPPDPPIELLDETAAGEAPRVAAAPALLAEALGRFLRAAVGWAETAPSAVRLVLRRAGDRAVLEALISGEPHRVPTPEALLEMCCPSESGAVRAERGPLGVMLAGHLLRAHGGTLASRREPGGVVLSAELPLCGEAPPA